jgi:uncharacterized RDD family membrane protein YckC
VPSERESNAVDRGDTSIGSSDLGVGAHLGPRAVARVIDSFLIGVFIIYAIGIAGFELGFTANVLSVAIVMAYFTLMESYSGRTIGKMILGLRSVGPDGGVPSLEMAFRRNVWYLLGFLPYLGGLAEIAAVVAIAVTISRSPKNIGWHDIFAGGTLVIPRNTVL